jgi:hypothetical protein
MAGTSPAMTSDGDRIFTARHGDRAVADDEDFQRDDLERLSLGDTIDFLLHRAGVGVDVYSNGL